MRWRGAWRCRERSSLGDGSPGQRDRSKTLEVHLVVNVRFKALGVLAFQVASGMEESLGVDREGGTKRGRWSKRRGAGLFLHLFWLSSPSVPFSTCFHCSRANSVH